MKNHGLHRKHRGGKRDISFSFICVIYVIRGYLILSYLPPMEKTNILHLHKKSCEGLQECDGYRCGVSKKRLKRLKKLLWLPHPHEAGVLMRRKRLRTILPWASCHAASH